MKSTAKRRRGKYEIKAQKEAEERKQAEIVQKLAQFEEMQKQINALQQNAKNAKAVEACVHGLIDSCLVKDDGRGNYTAVSNFEEHQRLYDQK